MLSEGLCPVKMFNSMIGQRFVLVSFSVDLNLTAFGSWRNIAAQVLFFNVYIVRGQADVLAVGRALAARDVVIREHKCARHGMRANLLPARAGLLLPLHLLKQSYSFRRLGVWQRWIPRPQPVCSCLRSLRG